MDLVCIGKIINTHGLKGEVKIQSYSDFDEERYKKGNEVYIYYEDEYIPFIVDTYRSHKNNPLVSFKDNKDINLIEKYKGSDIYFDKANRAALKDDYYQDELIGLKVVDENGEEKGVIIAIEPTNGAQNNLLIQTSNNDTFLYPFIYDWVINVDLENKILKIKWLEGTLWELRH